MAGIDDFLSHAEKTIAEIEAAGLRKHELAISSSQSGRVATGGDRGERNIINLCSNNYLGLADHPAIVAAAKASLDHNGYGMASARFISGTHSLHLELEKRLAQYLGKDDAILFCTCFDANTGLFEALLGPEDAIVSDALNHASIIDGVRLSKAMVFRFAASDMSELEASLGEARSSGARFIMIATDGVFSMDGHLAKLKAITRLAQAHGAVVMVDDCHAVGIIGPHGRGTPHLAGVVDDVHILTGTFGKSLGGAIGGYVAGPRQVIELLRQKARPYIFSNALPPSVAAATLAALDLVEKADDLRADLVAKTSYWRGSLGAAGFQVIPGDHPITPVMLGEADLSQRMARSLAERGVHVVGLQYPVVPRGKARIRTQVSVALDYSDLDRTAEAFVEAGRDLGVI